MVQHPRMKLRKYQNYIVLDHSVSKNSSYTCYCLFPLFSIIFVLNDVKIKHCLDKVNCQNRQCWFG